MGIQLTGFAEACFDGNSISELVEALVAPADEASMVEWGIGPEEYFTAIEQALVAKLDGGALYLIKRAAYLLAELPREQQTPQILDLRVRLVDYIKTADPAYFGLPAKKQEN